MHRMHDGSIKAAHCTGHMFHEKKFWAIVAILALVAGLFTLIALNGGGSWAQEYGIPLPYGSYF